MKYCYRVNTTHAVPVTIRNSLSISLELYFECDLLAKKEKKLKMNLTDFFFSKKNL